MRHSSCARKRIPSSIYNGSLILFLGRSATNGTNSISMPIMFIHYTLERSVQKKRQHSGIALAHNYSLRMLLFASLFILMQYISMRSLVVLLLLLFPLAPEALNCMGKFAPSLSQAADRVPGFFRAYTFHWPLISSINLAAQRSDSLSLSFWLVCRRDMRKSSCIPGPALLRTKSCIRFRARAAESLQRAAGKLEFNLRISRLLFFFRFNEKIWGRKK